MWCEVLLSSASTCACDVHRKHRRGINLPMTKLLEQAIAKARELSEAEQDAIADALFAHLAGDDRRYRLSPEQVADAARIREELRSGHTRLATDEEVAAVWRKCGL